MIKRNSGQAGISEHRLNLILFLVIPLVAATIAWLVIGTYLRSAPHPQGPARSSADRAIGVAPGLHGDVLPGLEGAVDTAVLRFPVAKLHGTNREKSLSPRGGTLLLGNCGRKIFPVPLSIAAHPSYQGSGGAGLVETGTVNGLAGFLRGAPSCEGSALVPSSRPDYPAGLPNARRILL